LKKEIAVLMPVYNPGQEIRETLESLKAQTAAFKLFVIDDGSLHKPDYAGLLKDFDHHLIISPKNIGVNEARNPALKRILSENFEFIALIDCGDIAKPNRLSVQLDFLNRNSITSILGSWTEMEFAETGGKFLLRFPSGDSACRKALWVNMPVSHPSLMIRGSVFRKIGLYSGQYTAAEDYDFLRRAADAGFCIDNVQQTLMRKIETRDSISWKKRSTQLSSRIRIQWKHRDLANFRCWIGLLKTTLLRLTPNSAIQKIKQVLDKN
jgi:glycosyltransferase involved in cell wall biosynthesis